jgi:hypothetical protein
LLEDRVTVDVEEAGYLGQVEGHAGEGLGRGAGRFREGQAAACCGQGIDQGRDARVGGGAAEELAWLAMK